MFGEKAEEAEELKLDIQDLKSMYRQQVSDCLAQLGQYQYLNFRMEKTPCLCLNNSSSSAIINPISICRMAGAYGGLHALLCLAISN